MGRILFVVPDEYLRVTSLSQMKEVPMRILFVALSFALAMIVSPCLADLPSSETLKITQSPATLPPPSIFAYPGQSCPGGSEIYKGPEQELAAKSGAVFCRFVRKVTVISKKMSDKCPVGMRPYSGGGAKPGEDVIWCEPDPSQKTISIPAPPPQPKQPE
jgi:hypothetical protein